MKVMKLYLLIILGLLLGKLNSKAISPFYTNHTNFKQLTIQDGLKDNTVLSIHKDSKGIMWLGTSTGLSKYDGNHFTNYTLDQYFSMNVRKIEEDSRHILYLQTNDWITYMDCKDENTGRLHTLVKNKDYQVTDFLLLNDSTLFACDNQTLSSFRIMLDQNGHPFSKLEKVYPFEMAKGERFMKFCITNNHRKIYLVTNSARVLLLEISTGRVLKQKRLLTTKHEFGASSVVCHNGKLFISSMLHGIFIMDTSLENLSHIANQQNIFPTHLSHNDVYNIIPISDSSILATTWYGYTMLLADNNIPGGWTTEIRTSEPTWQSLNFEARMISSYYDPHGFLWIGTHGGGVLVSDWKWNFIKQYNFKEDNEVESIIIDDEKRIYLSTYEQGIFYTPPLYDLKDFGLRELSQTDRKTVLCSMKDKDGNIWFGYKNGMLVFYSPQKKEVQKYNVTDTPINVLFTDSKKNFWIGTENGLFLYDCDKKKKKEVKLKQTVNCVFDIAEDNEGNLWIASLGLLKLNYANNKQHIQHFPTNKHTYTAQTVLAAKDGTVYVGYQNGLGIVAHGETTVKQVFTTMDGLGSNWINCLLEDKQGYIWIGTNSGFSCYDKSINQFYNYYASGSSRSVALWGDMLCWGGNKHLLFFSPQQAINTFKANTKNPIIITGIEVNNKPLIPGKPVNGQMVLTKTAEYTDYISLSHKNRDFALSFSNSPYPTAQKYVYRLIPYQNEWIECNSKEKISYANLLPGNYTFQIKNQKAVKEEDITSLKINIQPHWTQTWMFRFFVLLVIIGGIYYSIFTIKRKHQRDQLIAELEHGIAIYKLQYQQADQLSHVQEQGTNYGKDNEDSNLNNPSEEKDYPLSDYLEAPVPQQSNTNNEFKQSNQYIFMQKVINVIEDNIANENFNVKILADTLCMSQPTLYRKVKEHFHLTVTELIRKMRMNKAASLLAMRKYSILEITEMVGYNDYETFRKHFKSQFGVSASKYVNCE